MMRFPRDVRDSNPLESLPDTPIKDDQVAQAIARAMMAALPGNVSGTLFDLGLAPLFVQQMWENMGNDSDANAAATLHNSLTRDPQCPGLSHFSRSILALTLCARWGGQLGVIDQQLRDSLRALVEVTNADAVFWAEYIGAVAAAMATVIPARPKTAERVTDTINFSSIIDDSGKKPKIRLTLTLRSGAAKGIDLNDLEHIFKKVGKTTNSDIERMKVEVQVHQVSRL